MDKLYIYKNITSNEIIKKIAQSYNLETFEIIKNEYGKPYFKKSNVFFNISHCDDLVVAYASCHEVGIDIQKKPNSYSENLMKKVLTINEINILKDSENMIDEFTRIWAMKESYVKMKGIGIGYGLKNVDTTVLKNYFKVIAYDNYYIVICKEKGCV